MVKIAIVVTTCLSFILLGCSESGAIDHNNAGYELQEQGRLGEAIAEYEEAIRLNPRDADAYYNRGSANDELGQYQRAIQDYDEALRLNPRAADYYHSRGIAYHELGQYQRAINDYGKALGLTPLGAPQDVDSYFNRAISYTFLGKDFWASQDIERAVERGADRTELEANVEDAKKRR